MTDLQPTTSSSSARLLSLAACLILAAGSLVWWRLASSDVPPAKASDTRLLQMLEGHEEEATVSQEEMERRFGTAKLEPWRAALDSNSAMARSLAVESVGKNRSPESVKILTAALEDPDSQVRLNAVQALASQDPKLALRPMLAAIEDEDTWLSEAAASKVYDLKRPESVPVLIAALRSPDRETGVFALGALKHLTGQKFHAGKVDSPQRWDAVTKQWEKWWAGAQAKWPASPDAQNVSPIYPTRTFPAPDFQVTDSAGNPESLASLRGKVVLVNFWGIGCAPCIAEMPGLNAVAARYRDRGLVVLGLENNAADPGTLRGYAVKQSISYPLAPANEAVRDAYGHIHDVPVSVLIDRQGRIRYRWEGDREESVFDAAVKRVLAE
jgi:cytochrome c biogenesis protein CcmG/thiol:disulfide interchange protein DsbE